MASPSSGVNCDKCACAVGSKPQGLQGQERCAFLEVSSGSGPQTEDLFVVLHSWVLMVFGTARGPVTGDLQLLPTLESRVCL